MLVQVVVIVKHITTCAEARVTTCPACFLNVVFQRIGNVIMYHKADIFLVYSHTECRRSYDDVYLVVHESVLVGIFFISFHLAIERQCLVTVASQFCSQFHRSFGT